MGEENTMILQFWVMEVFLNKWFLSVRNVHLGSMQIANCRAGVKNVQNIMIHLAKGVHQEKSALVLILLLFRNAIHDFSF